MAQTTVNFNLKTAGFSPFASQSLTFTLLTAGADKTDDSVILPGTITATSAANGTGSVVLFRNGDSDIDSVYEVVFPNRQRSKFVIPINTPTISLSHLLVDHVPSGAATQQSSVYIAAIQRSNHEGTQALSTISDAGTIASQASNNVSISGGSISGVTLTASTANLTDATNKRLMTDDQETRLDSVATNADVTATANVRSANALMDDEVDDLTGIKSLLLPDDTTISDFGKTYLAGASAAAVKSTLGISDATAQTNFFPRSISFTDSNAYFSLANNANLNVGTGDFSFSFGAKVSSSLNTSVLQKNGSVGYALFFQSGVLKLKLNNGTTSDFTLSTSRNDNKWHTYVVTVDRDDTAVAYIDGVAETPIDVSQKAGNLDNDSPFQIGKVGSASGTGISLGNYLSFHKTELGSIPAANIYYSPDTALNAGATQLMLDLRRADKTFTDISTNGFFVTTNGTIIFNEGRITSLDGVGDINCSSISADVAATGLNVIFDGTDTGDNKITLTDNLASALDITESTNSYLKFTTTNSGEKIVLGKDLDISGDHDLIIGTSTGTKIGTAVTQKIGFFNATPAAQQSTVNTTTGFTEGSGGTAAKDVSTFTGNFGTRAYTVGDIVKALKTLGLLQKDN